MFDSFHWFLGLPFWQHIVLHYMAERMVTTEVAVVVITSVLVRLWINYRCSTIMMWPMPIVVIMTVVVMRQ